MKIDVITLNAVKNYGSVLQAFATQEFLKEIGGDNLDVTIINYIREDSKDEHLMSKWCGKNLIKRIAFYPTFKRWKKVFGNFNKNYLNLTDKVYTTEEDFKKYPLEADAYCTGSDQTWNSKWNKGIIPTLYLSFVPSSKYKFSFAASFGQSQLSQEEVDKTINYLKEYKKISVRESSGLDIINNHYHLDNGIHIVDPTLCVTGEFWRKYATPRKIKEDYILIYNLNRSKEFDKYAKELSKKTGLKLVRFCTRYDQILRCGKSMLVPEVFDFISLIDNATYVLTDSFHATAFSLNLNTEPICIYPNEFGGRLESILKQTHQLQRHVKSYDDFDVVNRKVDFNVVNEVLEQERQRAINFVKDVYKDIENSISK